MQILYLLCIFAKNTRIEGIGQFCRIIIYNSVLGIMSNNPITIQRILSLKVLYSI